MSKLLRGTLILSGAIFISKFLGMIYVFPFYELVGSQGGVLFYYAYSPYTIMLSLSTLGIPLAVSKFVAKYNALEDYETGRRLFNSGLLVMTSAGILSFLLLNLFAPFVASFIVDEGATTGNTLEDVVYVIRMVSFALIIVPVMSLIRGYFQGFQSMTPTAVSQVVEQIIRIIVILGGSYLVLRVYNGETSTAIGISVFAAFVGAVASMIVLWFFWMKKRPYFKELNAKSATVEKNSLAKIYKELVTYALPFVFFSIAIPLYQLVDTVTYNRTLVAIGYSQQLAEQAQSVINFYGHKLVMIPFSLTLALALSLIPAITNSYTLNDTKQLNRQISQSLQIIIFLILPMSIGMSVMSYEIYGLFYGPGPEELKLGSSLLKVYAPVALVFGLFTVTASILQGIDQQKLSVISIMIGFALKASLNVPLLTLFHEFGSIYATMIGFTFTIVFNIIVIKRNTSFSFRTVGKQALMIIAITVAMIIPAILVRMGMYELVGHSRLDLLYILLASTFVAGSIYVYLGFHFQLFQQLLGHRISFLRKRKRKKTQKEG
jgi:O-antigen/teichoic acid export membrane protein